MRTLIITIVIFSTSFVLGQSSGLREADKYRIKEAIKIAEQYGDSIWEGYRSVPFVILLVTDSVEFLINHPNPSKDFKFVGKDKVLQTNIFVRKKQFSPHLLATFPAVNGLSCIVVGTPENTNKNSSEWIITLLHEHFHQYQHTYPDYYESVNKLNLSKGDNTGMWMLNYPFPYDSVPVIQQFELYTQQLYKTAMAKDDSLFEVSLINYQNEKLKFKQLLSDDDYSYFSFQVWQEGIARYTEFKFLEYLKNYTPSEEVLRLPDFVPFNALKKIMYISELEVLHQHQLNEHKRVTFYSVGFAEGIILDRVNKNWHQKYFSDKFFIENYIKR
ncbi:MAG: hypothetical protein OEX22_08795 [Cyclobacteriaceae bacterium]|nr:hypothetical protein [Cyclobacteriaceae bacterium]